MDNDLADVSGAEPSSSEAAQQTQAPPKLQFAAVGRSRQSRLKLRLYNPGYTKGSQALCNRAVYWLLPWKRYHYPGLERGACQVLGALPTAVHFWRLGKNRLPQWAADKLAAEIERRCRVGLVLVEELRQYSAEWKPADRSNPAWRKIDPETGTNRQFRG